jgi:hypothetical protein
MNSTPSKPHSIILFTALSQPQPTQITLIFAIGEIVHDRSISSGPDHIPEDIIPPLPESKFFNLSSLVIVSIINCINCNYGNIFLKTFAIELKNHHILKLNHPASMLYLLLKISVQITEEHTGSLI